MEDPYWVCDLCGEQTQSPSVVSNVPILPTISSVSSVSSNTTTTVVEKPFRILQSTGTTPKPIVPIQPKLGLPRSLTRSTSARAKTTSSSSSSSGAVLTEPTGSYTDRKYLSKKKQQAVVALQTYRGENDDAPPPADVVSRVKEAWTEQSTQPNTTSITEAQTQLIAVLRALNLKRHTSDLGWFLRHITHTPLTISTEVETTLLNDFDRLLRAYLRVESSTSTTKRRALDCSYVIYQLLKHHGIPVCPEQVACRDREYHDSVYSKLASDLGLGFWAVNERTAGTDRA